MSARKPGGARRGSARPVAVRGKASGLVPAASPLMVHARAVTIVHVSAEVSPWARVGELGDTVAELAAAQAATGRPVIVVAPAHHAVMESHPELVPVGEPFDVAVGDRHVLVSLLGEVSPEPLRPWLLFVDHRPSFDRDGVYADANGPYPDNAERFALFAHAALAAVRRLVAGPVVVHAHDWHAALVPVILQLAPRAPDVASVLTIHDAAFQGHVGVERLGALGVNGRCYTPAGLEWYGRVNLLKGGIAFADQVVVTSPAHAAELCTSAGGFGLDGIFRWRQTALFGIRNGLDATRWNPATDTLITTRFGPGTVGDRAKNKQALQRSAKLPVRARTPVVLLPAPLTLRTGASLALASALLRSGDAQLVIGASGEHALVDEARALSGEFPDRVALLPLWDDRMERRALAGADIVLAPSRHEPSGLLASRALRYGAVVVLRATGAHGDLADSDALFRFQSFDGASLDRALGTALDAFADKATWAARVKAALSVPVGWGDAVSAYDARYLAALAPGAVA